MKHTLKSLALAALTLAATTAHADSSRELGFAELQKEAVGLVDALIPQVDNCFNMGKDNAKKELAEYKAKLSSLAPATAKDPLAALQADLDSKPIQLLGKTKRQGMLEGFEGNDKYPNCKTVGGDKTKNDQYLKALRLVGKDNKDGVIADLQRTLQ